MSSPREPDEVADALAIVAGATRIAVLSGAGISTASYLRHALGDDYTRRLYVDQKPVFTRDHRELADWLAIVFADVAPSPEDVALHVSESVRPAIATLGDRLAGVSWDKASIAVAIKETLAAHGLKMPQLAPAVRVLVLGRAQTPSLDAVLEVFDRAVVLARLRA